ncbi:MAG TPA: DoxX family protein [Phenylobacterium sp.]|nr:DoxX family protein [Phenylobacterium sp.]
MPRRTSPLVLLSPLARFDDAALLILRLLIGAFLMWGTWDNIASAARMQEFVAFLANRNCPLPTLAGPVSVYAQFIAGALILLGFLTRWAGLLMAFNFVVAVALTWAGSDFRGLFPPLVMIAVSLVLATRGPGLYSLEAQLDRRR